MSKYLISEGELFDQFLGYNVKINKKEYQYDTDAWCLINTIKYKSKRKELLNKKNQLLLKYIYEYFDRDLIDN